MADVAHPGRSGLSDGRSRGAGREHRLVGLAGERLGVVAVLGQVATPIDTVSGATAVGAGHARRLGEQLGQHAPDGGAGVGRGHAVAARLGAEELVGGP